MEPSFSSVFEATSEKKRILENMDERKVEKRFLSLKFEIVLIYYWKVITVKYQMTTILASFKLPSWHYSGQT